MSKRQPKRNRRARSRSKPVTKLGTNTPSTPIHQADLEPSDQFKGEKELVEHAGCFAIPLFNPDGSANLEVGRLLERK